MAQRLKASVRHKQILGAALRLFRKQGYERTPMREIAEELQMSKAGLYHHFQTKDDILYRVPKKFVVVYLKDHQKNLHATCLSCAHSTVITGPEKERVLSSLGD